MKNEPIKKNSFVIKIKRLTPFLARFLILLIVISGIIFFIKKDDVKKFFYNKDSLVNSKDDSALDLEIENIKSESGKYLITYYINGIEEMNIKKSVTPGEKYQFDMPEVIMEKIIKASEKGSAEAKIIISWDTGREEIVKIFENGELKETRRGN